VYTKADGDVISALQMLTTEADVTETMLATLARFVCAAYSPKGTYIKTISTNGVTHTFTSTCRIYSADWRREL